MILEFLDLICITVHVERLDRAERDNACVVEIQTITFKKKYFFFFLLIRGNNYILNKKVFSFQTDPRRGLRGLGPPGSKKKKISR